MVRKQKIKYPITLLNSNSVLYGIVTVIIFSIVLYFLWGVHQEKREDTQRIEDLNKVGVILDEVKDKLKDSGVNARIERYSYCWRTGEKYGEGTRYCDQRLLVYGSNKIDSQITKDSWTIYNTLVNIRGFDVPHGVFEGEYNNGSIINIERMRNNVTNGDYKCVIEYDAYSASYIGPLANSYYVDIICDQPINTRDIYPLEARYSSDFLMKR